MDPFDPTIKSKKSSSNNKSSKYNSSSNQSRNNGINLGHKIYAKTDVNNFESSFSKNAVPMIGKKVPLLKISTNENLPNPMII